VAGGHVTFSVATVRRALAVGRAEDEAEERAEAVRIAARAKAGAKPAATRPEVVEMLDVDEINQIRVDRFHALGLAAPGEDADPDEATIAAARAAQAASREPTGEVAGQAGDVVVVTKGGIAGWIKRNKGKKADPETLAWLRGQEAEEGRAAYAGWADREDGDILAWSKEQKRNDANDPNDTSDPNDHPEISAALDGITKPGVADGSAVPPTTASTQGSATAPPSATTPSSSASPSSTTSPRAAGAPNGPTPRPLHRFRLARLGNSAVRALELAANATAPTPQELAPVRARIEAHDKSLAMIARDQRVVVLLRGDVMFRESALTGDARRLVRELAQLFAAMPGRGFRLSGDPDRAMEIASTLVTAGLSPERIEIALKSQIDPALDLLEIEILASPTMPPREPEPTR